MKFPHAYVLVQNVILGFLAGDLIAGVAWLVLGSPPSFAVCLFGGEALLLAVTLAVKSRRARERRRLQAAFDRPAFGEDPH